MKYDVFISYCSDDRDIVSPLSKLLRLEGSNVFLDHESILPGSRWEDVIDAALESTYKLALFWCCHAKASAWVDREVQHALERDKPLIPILLCSEPLPPLVAEYQALDLRQAALHWCNHRCRDVEADAWGGGDGWEGPARPGPEPKPPMPRGVGIAGPTNEIPHLGREGDRILNFLTPRMRKAVVHAYHAIQA